MVILILLILILIIHGTHRDPPMMRPPNDGTFIPMNFPCYGVSAMGGVWE